MHLNWWERIQRYYYASNEIMGQWHVGKYVHDNFPGSEITCWLTYFLLSEVSWPLFFIIKYTYCYKIKQLTL